MRARRRKLNKKRAAGEPLDAQQLVGDDDDGGAEAAGERKQQFVDAGCHSFCVSGYLHHEEAERFGRWVLPRLAEQNPGRVLEAA